jgi:hypothetical protein
MRVVSLIAGKYKSLTDFDLKDFLNFNYLYKKFSGYSLNEIRQISTEDLQKIQTVFCNEQGKEGTWKVDFSDTNSVDNTGTVIRTNQGVCLKRVFSKGVLTSWFEKGIKTNTYDYSDSINDALEASSGFVTYIKNGKYRVKKPIRVKQNRTLIGIGRGIGQNAELS